MSGNQETVQQQIARLTSFEHCILLGCSKEYGHVEEHDTLCSCGEVCDRTAYRVPYASFR